VLQGVSTEHGRRLIRPDKSAVGENSVETVYRINIKDMTG